MYVFGEKWMALVPNTNVWCFVG